MNTWPATETPDLALRLFLLLFGIGLVTIALWALRPVRRTGVVSPRQLFLRLSCALRLSLFDRWLLASVARHRNLPAAALLLSPHTLRHHARPYLAARARFLRPALARRLEYLAQQMTVAHPPESV